MRCSYSAGKTLNRRQWMTAAAGLAAARPARSAPTAPVAIERCPDYGSDLLPAMERLFDRIGGLGRLVQGKTVALKVNMTGGADQRLAHYTAEDTYWTHPALIAVVVHLMGRAGAKRVRVIESFAVGADPLEEHMLIAGWEPTDILRAAPKVEIENTGFLGYGKRYSRLNVPGGGYIFPAFDLNHSYEDCDVFVSIAKLKEHATAGVTIAMKNLFGIAPPTIYGNAAGVDEPALVPRGGRQMFHTGYRQPSRSAPPEHDPSTPREGGYRVPRIVVDLVAARPIHLSIVDAIWTMTTGEGPWINARHGGRAAQVKPGVLIAGTNPVCTDAVGMAVMGFDPMAERGSTPFEECDSTLKLAEDIGIGTRDLRRIEVAGAPIHEVAISFRGAARRS
jgi:uncharacterized protein (DUF362 family)